MTTRFQQFVVVVLSLLIASLALAQDKPKGTRLTGADLETLYRTNAGTMIEVQNHYYGSRSSIVYMRNGETLAQWVDPAFGPGQDSGTWRIVDDTLWVKYKSVVHGALDTCFRIFKVGENTYESWFADRREQQNSTFRVRP